MNIRQLLESRVRQHPEKAFVIFEDQVISYTDFDTTVNRVAHGFLRLGISAGDRVCVMLSNCPEFLYAWFGLMKIGAILVPINSAFRHTETQYIVQHAAAAAIVVDAATGPVVADIATHLPGGCQRISLATTPTAGEIAWSDVLAGPSTSAPMVDGDANTVASLIYTSGTTGQPKGVMQPHRSYVIAGESFAMRAGLSAADLVLKGTTRRVGRGWHTCTTCSLTRVVPSMPGRVGWQWTVDNAPRALGSSRCPSALREDGAEW